jgi:hypothetical protein
MRKPREMSRPVFPRVEVSEGKIWFQGTKSGNWVRVPLGRAKKVHDRLTRAIKHISRKQK